MLDLNAIWTASSRNSGEYLLGGATSSSFPVQDNPIGSLSGNFVAPHLKRPANTKAVDWRVNFNLELEDPYWNLLVREFLTFALNPRHPAVLKSGVILGGANDPRTLSHYASHVRTAARWGAKNGVCPGTWTVDDLRQRITDLATEGRSPQTVRHHVSTLKSLAAAAPALSLPWPAVDPWPGQSARVVAEVGGKTKLSTPVVPPGTWFPLIRAAWAYIHDFAPDVMRADRRFEELLAAANPSSFGLDARLEEWLADPQNKVPIHTAPAHDLVPHVNWSLLTLLLGYDMVHRSAFSDSLSNTAKARLRRRALIMDAVAAGRTTSHALVGELTHIVRPDGSTGPWHHGIDPRALKDLKLVLRDAAFVLVVGLSMMRDSEIHEILRAPVVEHYSTPAISSTKIKGTIHRPGKHWWIAEPLVEALAEAEAVSSHQDRVFAAVGPGAGPEGTINGVKLLRSFMTFVNSHRDWTGLDEIPITYIRPHMFRRTMAMLTDQFPGSEIATGIQLKHLAKRALANATTRSYAASDSEWARYLGDALDNVKFRKIKDLYERHTAGEEIGFGPGAQRVKDAFDQIDATVKARSGDARTADTLLRTTRIHIRFGMLNNCTADHANPVGAVCLENAIIPEGHTGPLDERCRPDRCANSMIGPEHLPIYDSHQRKQLELINNPSIPVCRRDLAERELDITRNVLKMVGELR
ncbi:hypothetical protein OK006_11055 [Actinobacteria bacterium OK006]|nr:hypothetical protein OK006_11055 [Actinobacteria bacterium OK006]